VRCSAPASTIPAPTADSGAAAIGSPAPAVERPKYGSTLRVANSGAVTNLDLQAPGGSPSPFTYGCAYSQLLKYKHGPDIKPPAYLVTGDLAESWEQPDDLTYIFKLRPGVKWQNIAPVNGRELVAEDVKYSFERILGLKVNASLLGDRGRAPAGSPA
jgi:ABC-type transport system substrate-binding protein